MQKYIYICIIIIIINFIYCGIDIEINKIIELMLRIIRSWSNKGWFLGRRAPVAKGFRKGLLDGEGTALTVIFKTVFSIDFKQAFYTSQIQPLIVTIKKIEIFKKRIKIYEIIKKPLTYA